MDFDCSGSTIKEQDKSIEWNLCKTERERGLILKESTFSLIPCAIDEKYISTPMFLVRLLESLKFGAVPLILGGDQMELPYSEVKVIYFKKKKKIEKSIKNSQEHTK